jgi:hypothetical protein
MSDFSKFDRLESLRFEGYELSEMIGALRGKLPHEKLYLIESLQS